MRGRLSMIYSHRGYLRNTPAYAGKTYRDQDGTVHRKKHPRVCGEDRVNTYYNAKAEETPPRMRGRLLAVHIAKAVPGNTPAYAGKTRSPLGVRGEM